MMLCDSPTEVDGLATTLTAAHLFRVNDDAMLFNKAQWDIYVNLVMQGLNLSQQGHPDIQTAISLLCSHIQTPNMDDYKKLAHLMRYLHGTQQ